ncbi:MAG: hypothetical protein GXP24_10895 [Planctomycetes bacterium]|nr:hypothetical protein [Planctomycetota bacterium]
MLATCLLVSTSPCYAASDLTKQVQPLIDAHDGKVGVAIVHLPSGESFTHRAEEPMPTASLIKFPLMIATYQAIEAGNLDLEQKITLRDEDKVPGSGILTPHFSPGATLSLNDAMHLMIVYSDNTATNLVIDQVGLPATAQRMESLDCPATKLHSQVFRRDTSIFPERSKQFGLGSTSAADMLRLFTKLHAGKLVSKAASQQMLAHLYECESKNMCARDLPPNTKFAHKSGSVSAVRADAGIIDSPSGPIVVCVLTAENEDRSWSSDNAAQVLGGKIARAAYDYFNPAKAFSDLSKPQPLAIGSSGHLVEALQRTLNARTKPSVDIGVDGDFGPNTERAVQAFQRANQLPDSGQVDAKTWEALGPLLTKDPNQPAPSVINARKIAKRPADPLTGTPFVTCKAWAIGDGQTGKLLWGFHENEARDMASTTKIMTAFLVTTLAEKDTAVLEEIVTFSQRADDTIGSTAGVRVGEKVSVGELLYGLLLPSGNDASVALAEHFGERLAAGGNADEGDFYDQFIDAMNQTAQRLGMDKSSFENPNGLTSPKHKTSPRDLLTLSTLAMRQPLFRKIVGTVEHGCTVEGPEGYKRNLVWKNTNRLLRTEGYGGVKTGTTSAAGSCLVSYGTRGDKSLLVVVLGSSSTDARYADTRNLFRWAWQQLGKKSTERPPVVLTDAARKIHQSALLIDGHNDLPWELRKNGSLSFDKLDISQSQKKLQTDIPRLRKGGVGAQFWSVWVPASTAYDGSALTTTLEQIEMVHAMIDRYPETFERALTVDDIKRIHQSGKIASLIGVEGGHCIQNSLNVLGQLYKLGARYMTLTHSDTLDWADSATDEFRNGGLTAFGEDVVREMNRLGMMVDLSHVSPDTMKHALRITQAPVIFSHSSARAVADHPRNVPDDVLKLVAKNEGVVMVNFFSGFVVPAAADIYTQSFAYRREQEKLLGDDKAAIDAAVAKWRSTRPMPRGTIHDLIDHIDHIVKIAGIDHVGIGSDYDGVSVLPKQLEDVSTYPLITQALLDRGYSEADIEKILGKNLLRVMRKVEQVAKQMQKNK